MNKSIMFQGTGSGVGKSLVSAAFCRILSDRGVRIAPFKAQNMALNSGVTMDNKEMGRAQILQAEAARITPDVRMNPILLKPQGNGSSQLIRMGKPAGVISYKDYYTIYKENLEIVQKAYISLKKDYDLIIIEGAGSPAEINLQTFDIVNMKMANIADASVFIVGDIDRGGVFASFKGTYDLILPCYQKYIKGFIINKFRGDKSLLDGGIEMFKNILPVKICGVIPYSENKLDEEDSQFIKHQITEKPDIKIGIIKLKYMSNFTDFTPFTYIEKVQVEFISTPEKLEDMDIIIIPGTKNTVADLEFLKIKGFHDELIKLSGKILIIGICGGFQMLGNIILDNKIESSQRKKCDAMKLINMETTLLKDKQLKQVSINGISYFSGLKIKGYEIHHGDTKIDDDVTDLTEQKGLCVYKKSGNILGTYIHGIFDNYEIIDIIFTMAGKRGIPNINLAREKDNALNKLASMVEQSCDMQYINSFIS